MTLKKNNKDLIRNEVKNDEEEKYILELFSSSEVFHIEKSLDIFHDKLDDYFLPESIDKVMDTLLRVDYFFFLSFLFEKPKFLELLIKKSIILDNELSRSRNSICLLHRLLLDEQLDFEDVPMDKFVSMLFENNMVSSELIFSVVEVLGFRYKSIVSEVILALLSTFDHLSDTLKDRVQIHLLGSDLLSASHYFEILGYTASLRMFSSELKTLFDILKVQLQIFDDSDALTNGKVFSILYFVARSLNLIDSTKLKGIDFYSLKDVILSSKKVIDFEMFNFVEKEQDESEISKNLNSTVPVKKPRRKKPVGQPFKSKKKGVDIRTVKGKDKEKELKDRKYRAKSKAKLANHSRKAGALKKSKRGMF
eukprot:maker-scaffold_14-snap-gene-1.1-mRNA-1 protein AED:0.25 eAED:0.25 QI:89/1/1/1/1/1/4/182/364